MTPLSQTRKQDPRSIWAYALSLSIVVGIFGYLLVYHVHHEQRDRGHLGDFPTFYQAAQFAREPSLAPDRDLWSQQPPAIYRAGQNPDQMYVYPPLIAVLYMPLTYVSLQTAAMIMLFVTAAMLLASMLLGTRAMLCRLDRWDPLAFCVVLAAISILCENEMRHQLTMLETDALMLLCFILALWWLDRQPILSGVALALAFNIKYLSIVALPWLILRRRWSAAAAMVAGCAGFALLPAVQLGWAQNLRCLRVSMGGLLRWVGVPPETSGAIKVHNIADGLSVSITSGLARILGENGFTNSQIMVAAAAVGILALIVAALLYRKACLPLLIWPGASKQMRQPYAGLVALEWAGLVAVAVAFSPNTNARHLLLAMPVFIAGVILVLAARRTVSVAPAVAGILLIFWSFIMPLHHVWKLGYRHYRYSGPGWSVLIGYLLILWVGVRYLARKRSEIRD